MRGGWRKDRERAGYKWEKKEKGKKGIPSIPALFPQGLQADLTQSSEILPHNSLAELIQPIEALNNPVLSGKSNQGTCGGSPVKSSGPVGLNPVRLG